MTKKPNGKLTAQGAVEVQEEALDQAAGGIIAVTPDSSSTIWKFADGSVNKIIDGTSNLAIKQR